MNFKNNHLLKTLIFLLIVSLAITARSETNVLGQQITFINPEGIIKDEKVDKKSSIWSVINSGYDMKERPSRRIRNYEKWYSKRPEYVKRMLERSEKYLFHVVGEVKKRNMPMEIALLPMISPQQPVNICLILAFQTQKAHLSSIPPINCGQCTMPNVGKQK